MLTASSLWTLARKSLAAWNSDDAASMGAALAYYTLFSIAPLLIIVIAVAGLVVGHDAAQTQILDQLRGLVGDAGAETIGQLLKGTESPAKGVLATIAGTGLLLLGATTVFTELHGDLNRIWRAPSAPKASGLWRLLRTRVLSFGMVLGIGFLLLVSLVISAGLAAMGSWWGARFPGWPRVGWVLSHVVGLATNVVAFALIYKYLPRVRIDWNDVWIGATVTAVLFEIGKALIGLYIAHNATSAFGAAGSLVVLLIWFYYSSQVFFLGAEFTSEYAYWSGSKAGEEMPERRKPLKPAK